VGGGGGVEEGRRATARATARRRCDVEGEGETSPLFGYNMLRVGAVDGSRASALLGEGRHAEVLRAVLRMAKARSTATPAKNAARDARQGISVGEHIEPAEFRGGAFKQGAPAPCFLRGFQREAGWGGRGGGAAAEARRGELGA
jgi:hypothetical protein